MKQCAWVEFVEFVYGCAHIANGPLALRVSVLTVSLDDSVIVYPETDVFDLTGRLFHDVCDGYHSNSFRLVYRVVFVASEM
jgi:hypothetical protein